LDRMRSGRAGGSSWAVCNLSDLPLSAHGVVDSVRGAGDLRRRLLEMGFYNGARVTAVRRAPLGDPVEFHLRGYNVSLRKEEARCVQVLPDPPLERELLAEQAQG
jgi:Fe2+ transport system protein FeoA